MELVLNGYYYYYYYYYLLHRVELTRFAHVLSLTEIFLLDLRTTYFGSISIDYEPFKHHLFTFVLRNMLIMWTRFYISWSTSMAL